MKMTSDNEEHELIKAIIQLILPARTGDLDRLRIDVAHIQPVIREYFPARYRFFVSPAYSRNRIERASLPVYPHVRMSDVFARGAIMAR